MVKSETRLYLLSYVALLVLLMATVLIHELSLGWLGMLISAIIAVTKATVVLRNFMDLRIAAGSTVWFLGATLMLVYVAALLSLSDYLTRVPV